MRRLVMAGVRHVAGWRMEKRAPEGGLHSYNTYVRKRRWSSVRGPPFQRCGMGVPLIQKKLKKLLIADASDLDELLGDLNVCN